MKVSSELPAGVTAFLFDSAKRRRTLEDPMVAALERSGFEEAILPVLDYLDPYEQMSGAAGRQELYRFVDRDGEVLALRADFTPMLARLIAPRLASLELPLKIFYRGDVLRYEEDRAGRQREFYQLGAEVLGMPGEDGEELALRKFLELLAAGARHQLLVVMGFAGALDELLRREGEQGGDPAALSAAVVRRERSVARARGAALKQVVEYGRPDDPAALGERAAARLERLDALCRKIDGICHALKTQDPGFPKIELRIDLAEFADQSLDPELRRGLGARAYYDGLVFRAFAGKAAEPVGAGGRYDQLFHSLDAPVTASGFCVSLDRLVARGGEK